MIKYYPKNRITTDLYTKGNEFSLNGKPYIGAYYKTFNGKIYAGRNPVIGSSQELQSINNTVSLNSINTNRSTIVLSKETEKYTQNANILNLQSFEIPPQHYPQPTENDYSRGYFMRYFAKKRNQIGYLIEISKETYLSLLNKDSIYDYVTYEVVDIFWQLTGPLKDTRENRQYKVAGIIDTNKRLVETTDRNFRGLIEYIGNQYDKYARPTLS